MGEGVLGRDLTPNTVELISTLGALPPRGGPVQDSVLTPLPHHRLARTRPAWRNATSGSSTGLTLSIYLFMFMLFYLIYICIYIYILIQSLAFDAQGPDVWRGPSEPVGEGGLGRAI